MDDLKKLAEMLGRSEAEVLRLVQGRKLRPDQAAKLLNVSKRKVYDLVSGGLLLGFKIRGQLRIPQAALENYCAREILRSVYDTGFKFSVQDARDVSK